MFAQNFNQSLDDSGSMVIHTDFDQILADGIHNPFDVVNWTDIDNPLTKVVAKLVHHAVCKDIEHILNQLTGQCHLSTCILNLIDLFLDHTASTLVKCKIFNFFNHLDFFASKLVGWSLLLNWCSWVEIVEVCLNRGKLVHLSLLWHHLEIALVNHMGRWSEHWSVCIHHVVERCRLLALEISSTCFEGW